MKDTRNERDVVDLQRAVGELVRAYQFRDRKSPCYYDLSVTQCYALSSVIAHGPMTLNELAADLYLDKSTASRLVEALVGKGYMSRSEDPADARALRLEATGKGLELHAKVSKDLVEEMKCLVEGFDAGSIRAATKLVARLADAATERFGRKGRGGADGAP